MAATDQTIPILKLAIEDMRRAYEHISNTYDQLRVKSLALIAGEVALAAFIFSSDKLSIPSEYYGKVFFFAAIIFLGASFGLLLWTIASMPWKIPTSILSTKELVDEFPTEIKMLENVYNTHLECVKHCLPLVDSRGKRFNWTLYLLSSSAIMLLIIKFGGA